ncbi:MAG: alpha/beta hydrolase [Moraxellaceae bacterium]|nr:alpha/beta hydrolase [Moraxellaceae bacterium]
MPSAPEVSHAATAHVRPPYPLSWQARAFNVALMMTIKPVLELAPINPTTMRLGDRIYALAGGFLRQLPSFVRSEPARFANFNGEWLRAGNGLREDKVMLYLHGGGYFFSSAEAHRPLTWRLSRAAKRPVLAINYRQGPNHHIDLAREDALEAYQHLLDRGYPAEHILIGGDSAGGHLTLVTLQAIRDAGLPLPRAGLCFSPWTDLSCESGSYESNRTRDPMFASRAVAALSGYFATGRDPFHPHVSPLHGDFTGLPPLLLTAGSTEVLRDDSRRAAQKAVEQGVQVVYEEWRGMPHVFQLFAFWLPEARAAYRHISRFIHTVERD